MDRHPDRQARGLACLALARHFKRQAELARRCEADPDRAAEALGKEKADRRRREAGPLAAEAERLYRQAAEDYGDAKYGKDGTVGGAAKRELSILRNAPDLAVGKPAPEVEGEDIDGRPMRLSDYRGKVVVVAFWATWCGPCMRMVPHQRELVKRLDGKPFALLGVNNDRAGDRKKVRERVAQEGITWRSWWDGGPEGPIATRWCVEGWPAVYVLDAKGVIRYRGVTGDRLGEAVEALLKGLEGKEGGPPPGGRE
jgi:thiol-disulfide isomerase/thioredoxin